MTLKFTDYKIPGDPAFFLLHVSTISAKNYQKSVLRHLLNAAKACISLHWKKQTPPTVADWLRKVDGISKMEDLVLSTQHQQEKYSATWKLLKQFVLSAECLTLLGNGS